MPNNFRVDVYQLLAERYETKSNEKLARFRSQLEASYVSNLTEELWYKESIYLWMIIYIYIYIYICLCVCMCTSIWTAITQECCEQYWTCPGGNTLKGTNYMATCLPSRKLSKLDEPDMQVTAGEVMYSYGPHIMMMMMIYINMYVCMFIYIHMCMCVCMCTSLCVLLCTQWL